MHTILVCTNLLGDSLYLLGPVKKYIEESTGVVSIVVDKGLAGDLFEAQFSGSQNTKVFRVLEEAEVYLPDTPSQVIQLQAGMSATIAYGNGVKQLHISEGYSKLLGVDFTGMAPPTDWQKKMKVEKEYALISPFSKSCSRHSGEKPNKTLDDWKWEHVIRFLRKHEYLVKVIGGKDDRLKNVSIPENDYIFSKTLTDFEETIRKAHLVISVDNGIGHMASSIGVDTIILWPIVSCIGFIAPIFSPRTAICQVGDPNMVRPVQLLHGIRTMMLAMEKRNINLVDL